MEHPETTSFADVLAQLQTRLSGLTTQEASFRIAQYGPNVIHKRDVNMLTLIARQFTGNPLIIILAAATAVSYLLGSHVSAYYIFAMILLSVVLGFWNEYAAERTVEGLLKTIAPTTTVLRNDAHEEIAVSQLTIGDVILLSSGSIVPADLRLVSVTDLQMNESALTGESKTRFKTADVLPSIPTSIGQMDNIAFMGTSVDSGSAKGVVIRISKDTEFGKIAKKAMFTKPETDFERGLRGFGNMLVKTILILGAGIFAVNFLLGHPMLDSLLFALAIAVGLTPELLPVIVTISLAHGAGKLAKQKVIAKQLIAIENLGNMDVLCTDKTGTLTEGSIELVAYANTEGETDQQVLIAGLLANSAIIHRKIIGSGIDAALWKYAQRNNIHPLPTITKVDDEPFDYYRKAMFSVVDLGKDAGRTLIVKGAPDFMLAHCKNVAVDTWHQTFAGFNNDGLRVTVIASRPIEDKEVYTWDDVRDLEMIGYATFLDVPKLSAKEALEDLKRLNVAVKIITGDNELVTLKICKEVGMEVTGVLLGSEMEQLSDEQLKDIVVTRNIFARLTPDQKERVIKTLRDAGHTVGFMGDGINDIPSLRASDVGISVNTAVDVAKNAAAIVLLDKGLDVIADGITEGRRTFSNTLKYILMGTSSNFGNMFSAAGASFFLPFLPMTPVQILLTNGLYDLSQLSIPSDNVDDESMIKPRHWNIDFIKNYMIFFGPISSVYDFLTYGVMIFMFHAQGALFQTGWFIESMATEILVVFVIRTSRSPFFLSKPSKWLLGTCLTIVGVSAFLPFTPLAASLGFVTPPPLYFIVLVILVSTYLLLVEFLKQRFLKNYSL